MKELVSDLKKEKYNESKQLKDEKTYRSFFLYDQTVMWVSINTAIDMATKLFDYTVLQDRSLISNVRNTLVKLKISFVKKIDKNVGEYENYLASSSKFFQHMVLLAFGVETQEREVCLLYISRIVQFLNSKHNGTKNNFLFIEYNEEKTIQEVEVYGTTVCVITEGVPDHYDRVLIHSSDFPDALLAYYDSHEKLFILDDGKKILPVIGLKWLSISELTNTL